MDQALQHLLERVAVALEKTNEHQDQILRLWAKSVVLHEAQVALSREQHALHLAAMERDARRLEELRAQEQKDREFRDRLVEEDRVRAERTAAQNAEVLERIKKAGPPKEPWES